MKLDRLPKLRAGMTEEAHARVKKTIDALGECSDGWQERAETAERELEAARERIAELERNGKL